MLENSCDGSAVWPSLSFVPQDAFEQYMRALIT